MLRFVVLSLTLAACGRANFDRLADSAEPTDGADGADGPTDCDALSGLVGAWPMETADVTGTTVRDRSGAGRDGTITGSPSPVTGLGRVGDALDFAATTAEVSLATLPVVGTPGAATTFALWFFNPAANVDQVLFYAPTGPVAMPPRYDLWLTTRLNSEVTLCINSGTSDCWGILDPGLIGRWVHVAAVLVNGRPDGGALFIDGEPVVMACLFGSCDQVRTVANPITLSGPDSNYSWRGKLDEVRIYDRALSAPEVAALYACQAL